MTAGNWCRLKIGSLLRIKHGFAFKGKYFATDGPHIVLTPGNFYDEGGFKKKGNKEKYYTGPVPADYVLSSGDLIIAMTEQAEGLLGSSALVPDSDLYLHNQRLGLVTDINADLADKKFLHYLFNTWRVRAAIRASCSGVKVRHTSPSRIYEVEVDIPGVATQRKIAAVLSAYDDLIENNTRQIAILEEMARNLYREWFVEFRFPGHEGVRLVDSAVGLIPEGWRVRSLAHLFAEEKNTVKTGPFGSKLHAHDYRDEGVPLILVKHVKNGRLVEQDLPLVGQHKHDELQSYRLRVGDVVVTRVGYVGDSAYVHSRHDDWFFSGQMLRVRVPDEQALNSRFLAQQYQTPRFRKMIENFAVGATRLSLNTKILSSMPLLVPRVEVQLEFTRLVEPVDGLCQNLQKRNSTLRETRDLLLPRLISGEVDVSESPIETGGVNL